MVCKGIRRNATPFVCTSYHSTLRWAISRNATLFECMLCYSTLRWAISPLVWTLCDSTLRWAISRNATPFVCTLCHSTLPSVIHATLYATLCYPAADPLTSFVFTDLFDILVFFFVVKAAHIAEVWIENQLKYELQPTALWEILTNFKLLSSC